MKKCHYKCENCGADIIMDAKAESGKCEYCGAIYYNVDGQPPAEVHHYIGNVRITPAKIVVAISVVAALAAAIVILALYFAGVFSPTEPPVNGEFRHEKAYLYEGTYFVGTDMDEGEFVAFKDPSKQRGRILILTDPKASAGTSACIEEHYFASNAYFSVRRGLYVRVEDCNVFRIGDKTVETMSDGSFEGNMVLRGGTDLPAGNYVIYNSGNNAQYVNITCVIGGVERVKRLGSRIHLNIGEGDYVYLTAGKLVSESNAPVAVRGENGEYPAGQYKVGLDIPAGRYNFAYGNAGNVAWFVHNKSGSAFFDSDDEVSPTTTHGYVDLEDGDYIYLYMMSLMPQDGAQ